jgi:penicillin-binding protein 2
VREIPTRVVWFMSIFLAGFAVLSVQLYRLTVSQAAVWRIQAEQNMVRELPLQGPRGTIYDRKGRPLATSEPAFSAVLIKQDEQTVQAILPELAQILSGGDQQKADQLIASVLKRVKEHQTEGRQYEPLTISRKLDQHTVATLVERKHEFPGVVLVTEPTRHYPSKSLSAPVLGYVGQIGEEIKEPAFSDYQPNEVVGKAGLEHFYERLLRGKPGRSSIVVDPYGKPIKTYEERDPVPGNNLYLTLDAELQRVAEEALAKQMEWIKAQNHPQAKPVRGALVVQEVSTGAILAMVTVPTYDPNQLVSGLTAEEAEALFNANAPGFMYNWSLQGFPPGSTYKMATGLAGLELGAVGPYERIDCPATYWRYGNPRNWTGYAQGPADIARALAISCNPYFFELGYRMGIGPMSTFMGQLGFGKPTGIDLPNEGSGVNPTKESYGDRWQEGNVISVAIGQGDVLTTPLQLASYTAAVANAGVRYRPYLVSEVRSSAGQLVLKRDPEQLNKVQAKADSWQRIQAGMRQTVTSGEGTGFGAFINFPVQVAAKTGSAETGRGYANGLSVAYAPYEHPEIAVSVVIEGGSSGSWTSPVIRRVMAQYFGVRSPIPKEVPTYKDTP